MKFVKTHHIQTLRDIREWNATLASQTGTSRWGSPPGSRRSPRSAGCGCPPWWPAAPPTPPASRQSAWPRSASACPPACGHLCKCKLFVSWDWALKFVIYLAYGINGSTAVIRRAPASLHALKQKISNAIVIFRGKHIHIVFQDTSVFFNLER